MPKIIISTERAPAAIGPYSQAVQCGEFIFTSGQLGLDPVTGELVAGGVKEQARQAMENLSAVLTEAGACLENVVKTTCFLDDMNNFADFNAVYQRYFKERPPARSCVAAAALPKGALVEIEAVARL